MEGSAIDGDAASAGYRSSKGLGLAELLGRGGQRAAIDAFIFSVRCPEQFAKLPDKERLAIETANAAIRTRFSRGVLALIVALQERILVSHGSRNTFLDMLQEQGVTELNATFLSRRLGGANKKGPYGHWWLPDLIAEHCAGDTAPDQLRLQFARLWHTAYGELPKSFSTEDLGGSLAPASDEEIAEFIDPPEALLPPGAVPSDSWALQSASDLAVWADGFPDAVLFTDSHGTILQSNGAARALWGAGDEGFLGRSLLELLPSFDISRLPHFARSEDASQAGRMPSLRSEARRLDGQDLLVEVHSVRLDAPPTPAGETARSNRQAPPSGSADGQLMILIKDLTGVQRLETELVRQQRQIELILHTATEGIIRVGADAQITLANAAAASALAYEPSELTGRSFPSLTQNSRLDGQPQPYADTLLGRSLLEAKPCSLQGQVLKAKDGSEVRVDLRTTPVVEGDSRSGSVITFTVRLDKSSSPQHPFILPRDDQARAEASRLRLQTMEYHQLLIQILARMDEPGTEAVAQLCGALPAAARADLLRSAKEARAAIAVPAPALTLNQTHPAPPAESSTLSSAVHEGVRAATAGTGLEQTRFMVFAPPTLIGLDAQWLPNTLTRLIIAAAPRAAGQTPVTVSAAQRDQSIRVDVKGSFPDLDSDQMAQVEADVLAHGATLRTIKDMPEKGKHVIVLEMPHAGQREAGSNPDNKHHTVKSAEPYTPQRIITEQPRINIPGARPAPPSIGASGPDRAAQPSMTGTDAQNHEKAAAEPYPVPHTVPVPLFTPATPESPPSTDHDQDGSAPDQRPSTTSHPPASGEHTPAPEHTVQLVTGDYLLTVNPVDDSDIEVCPPHRRPGRPRKLTAAERPKLGRATRPIVVGELEARRRLPLLERQDERERLVRLLARGRSVRLTGPAGAGRTALLDVVAEDCSDLAPDGVVRLSGFHRTLGDLLHELFYAIYYAPLYRPDRDELLLYVREIGAIVVLDDMEFGGSQLDELLDAAPECAFLIGTTPDMPAPPADSAVEEVLISGLTRAGGLELLKRVVDRDLTEEEANWAGDIWFETEGLPLGFVQAGALLRQRGQLPSLNEAATPAPLLAAGLSTSARDTLRFAVALGGEVPHQMHLPALIGDTHADAALGELEFCGLVSPAGPRYHLAAGVLQQLQAAGYGDDAADRALTAAQHYAWWAGHPAVTAQRVCAEADALLATLSVLVPGTTASANGEEDVTVQLARTAALAFAIGMRWSAWERALRLGAEASRLAGEISEQAHFHHELGILALCGKQFEQARAELEASIVQRAGLADKRGTVSSRRALALVIFHSDTTSGPETVPVRQPPDTAPGVGSLRNVDKPAKPLSEALKRLWKKDN
ncbi:PAS domain-containing protein [Streptomyces aquilus]|uniref:PAS domain-containing protein n=1 Tax=Streptomyces aquilus TaxID=2548456 RepID=A0A3Q9BUM0_9ACTN|nr:PAS domain-containing protein [Streptomyces aquilus]